MQTWDPLFIQLYPLWFFFWSFVEPSPTTKRNITHIVVQNAEPFVVTTHHYLRFQVPHARVSLICLLLLLLLLLLVFFLLVTTPCTLLDREPERTETRGVFREDDLNQQNPCQPENCYQNRTIPASIDPHLFILSNFSTSIITYMEFKGNNDGWDERNIETNKRMNRP